MYRYILALILSVFLINSCSTVKKSSDINIAEKFPVRKPDLTSLEINCKIKANMDGFSQTVNSNILAMNTDSISMEIIGPLGIPVGKLFSQTESFYFYSTFENTLYSGSPNAKNLKKTMNLPLSFYDFVRLLRVETPGEPDDFHIDTEYKGSDNTLYKNDNNDEYIEYTLVSSKDNTIKQYQRKDMDGKIIIDVLFRGYKAVGDFVFPNELQYNFPILNTKLTITYEEIIPNAPIKKALSFPVPDGVQKVNLD